MCMYFTTFIAYNLSNFYMLIPCSCQYATGSPISTAMLLLQTVTGDTLVESAAIAAKASKAARQSLPSSADTDAESDEEDDPTENIDSSVLAGAVCRNITCSCSQKYTW